MTAWAIYDKQTGALERVVLNDPADLGLDMTGRGTVVLQAAPDLLSVRWNPQALAFEPFTPPRWRTSRQIFDLFTADEKAAILSCGIPEVIGLVLALQMAERVDLDSTFHAQGVALLAGLELIEPARAAQVLAGIPPA